MQRGRRLSVAAALVDALVAAAVLFSSCFAEPEPMGPGLALGWVGAARTELGGGSGWVVALSLPGERSIFEFSSVMDISATRHHEDGQTTTVWRAAFGPRMGVPPAGAIVSLAWAVHVDDHDGWGTGPKLGYGVGVFRERFEAYVLPAAYVWLGGKDADFDAGAEAEIRLVVGFRM